MRKHLGYFSEFAILTLVGLILIVGPLNFGSRLAVDQGWLHLMSALMLPLWMLRLVCLAEPFFVWTRITIPLLAFLLYVFAGYLFSDVKWLSRQDFLMVLTYTVLFLVIVNNLQRRWQLMALFWVVASIGVAEAADGIVRHYRGGMSIACRFFFFDCVPRWGFQNLERAGGTFFTTDHCSAYLEMGFVLLTASLVVLKRAWVRRIVLLYFGACILMGIALSRSRGGWISLVCTVPFLVVLVIRGRFLDFRSALVGLLVLGAIVYFFFTRYGLVAERLEDLITQGEPTRLIFYRAALEMGRDHPLFGVGPRLYDAHFGTYQVHTNVPEFVHCELLQIFADYGVVGLVLVGWLLFAFYRAGVRISAPKKSESAPYVSSEVSQRLAFAIGGTTAVFAISIHSLVDFVLHVMGVGVTCTVVAALLFAGAALRRKRSETDWDSFAFDQASRLVPLSSRQQKIMLCCLSVSFVLFFWISLNNHLSLRYLAEGEKQVAKRIDPDPEEAIQYYERAMRCDPQNYAGAYILAIAYYQKSGGDFEGNKEWFDKAIYWYGQAVRFNPYHEDALAERARRYLESNQAAKARQDYEHLIHLRPKNSSYHIACAQACFMEANYDCVRRHLEQALKIAPSESEAREGLEFFKGVPRPEDPDSN